ncbi:MFS transporter [Klebsiella variicola]|uniref:MFS transporter n=1 Tax=Klebsiella variicola TaxID=244366 RepID=UPI00359F133F
MSDKELQRVNVIQAVIENHRKSLVLVGYGLTPLGQILIALASGWPLLLLGRAVSWFGKGLRGPLRDAIVIQAVSPENRGRAFGFHRAADTIGAVLGPLLGVALLGGDPLGE